jgi:phosphohistidine swiveling domain-containing protein
MVRSGSSYCSASDLALTFGLGKAATVALEVEWPSGIRQQFANVSAGQFLTIDETRGILSR